MLAPSCIHAATTPGKKLENLTVVSPRPAIQTYPHAGVVGQPRRIAPAQNRPPVGHQGPWGDFTRGTGEAAGFGPVGLYGVAPWAEDWQTLRNPHTHNDPFDPLKFIRLNESGSIWLTFSGETRLRNWAESHPFLGSVGHPGSGRFGVRNLYGADLHLGQHIRFFGQLINADAAGWNGFSYGSTFRKRLDWQQGFLEIKGKLLHAHAGTIIGRQQFLDAPSYILYNRETPNVPLSWNGIRGYAIWSHARIDAYDFVQTNISPTKMFHDTEAWNTRLYGFDTTLIPTDISLGHQSIHTYLDLFYMGFKVNGSLGAIPTITATAAGATTRNNYGFRWFGSSRSLEFSIGGLYQGGTFNYAKTNQQRQVSAYAFNTIAGYRNPGLFVHPFLGIQADLYSGGNAAAKTGAINTYIAPFNPQTNYLDTTTYIAPSNLIDISPVIRITPRNWATLNFKTPFFWRDSTQDPVFGASGRYAFTNIHGGYIGVSPQVSLALQINRHLTWTQYGARFHTSEAMQRAGAKSGSYYQSNFVFRF